MSSTFTKSSVARWCAAFLFLLALTSCSSAKYTPRDWSDYHGPGAQYFQREELAFPQVTDPIEPVNRISAAVDYGLSRYLFAPLLRVYRAIMPRTVREHLTKAGKNLLFPGRGINNALQGEWEQAGEESLRFLVNTTIGVLGLFDPAERMGLEPHPEDFGQTFANWGWKKSTYLFLPIYGPSTIRDGLGKLPDEVCDPTNYFFPAAWVRRGNQMADEIEPSLRLVEASYDVYEPARALSTLNREVDIENFSWEHDESPESQTLDVVFLKFEDPEFPSRRTTATARVRAGNHIHYSYWLQPGPAPLVFIVPGLGGHRLHNAALGLAEIAYKHGNSVVTISNPTNWEFIEEAASVDVPGYVPQDAHDLHVALTAIDRDLQRAHPGLFTSKRYAGISMGAFQGLYIAAEEDAAAAEGLMRFDVYLAMDLPVSLEHAMTQVDAFYNAPLEFPVQERERRLHELLAKVLYLGQRELTPSLELPFTQLEARFLIGLSFRMDLQFVILQVEQLHHLGVLRTKATLLRRAPAFREASEYSYMEYMHAFVLPYFHQRDPSLSLDDAGARTLFERCDLHSIAEKLRSNKKVRLFANENDFLLRAEDKAWLRELFGDRVRFFPAGGHLGNLHRKEIQEIVESTATKTENGTAP